MRAWLFAMGLCLAGASTAYGERVDMVLSVRMRGEGPLSLDDVAERIQSIIATDHDCVREPKATPFVAAIQFTIAPSGEVSIEHADSNRLAACFARDFAGRPFSA